MRAVLGDDRRKSAGVDPDKGRAALTWLGLYGHVGFDVADQMCFWRHLPYPDDLLRLEPRRLRDARPLVEAGAARPDADGSWTVMSGEAEYRAALGRDAFAYTCPWGARHGRSRGPCKHVLAAAIVGTLRAASPRLAPAQKGRDAAFIRVQTSSRTALHAAGLRPRRPSSTNTGGVWATNTAVVA